MPRGKLVIVLCYLSLTPFCFGMVHERSFFGDQSAPHSFPYMAAIIKDHEITDRCIGALISQEYVLTAAQCVVDFLIDVILGSYDVTSYQSQKQTFRILEKDKKVHPDFDEASLKNNIALLRLPRKALIGAYVKPIQVAPEDSELFIGENAVFIGWGHILTVSTNKWQQEYMTILGNNKCRNYHNLETGEMCAGGAMTTVGTAHRGDAGAPLILSINNNETLIGIASVKFKYLNWGPIIFTRLSLFSNWIRESMVVDDTGSTREVAASIPTVSRVQPPAPVTLEEQPTASTQVAEVTTDTSALFSTTAATTTAAEDTSIYNQQDDSGEFELGE